MADATTLADAIEQYGRDAYLLTVSDDGPHTSHVRVTLDRGTVKCPIGDSAERNVKGNPNVSLLWPPCEPGGYSFIVNGVVALGSDGGRTATLRITKSVLHRPGKPAEGREDICKSDCQPLSV